MTASTEAPNGADTWLLLIHQLPSKPAYLRVRVWRRLQGLGAVALKNAVYVLPSNDQTREDFEWLRREVAEGGGEATVCEARLLGGLTDARVRALFDAARDADYEAIASEARALGVAPGEPNHESNGEPERGPGDRTRVERLRRRLGDVVAIDFFGANGREAVEGLVEALESSLAAADAPAEPAGAGDDSATALPSLRGRTWVTRAGVHVDRIASAWLIRRCIDPEPVFAFVPASGRAPREGELRFDMFEAEFTHEGDRCTFEVLLERAALADPALAAIGEIVHDIDLKDDKFGRPEADGIRTLIAGICMATEDDHERLARGASVFDDLHRYFQGHG